MVRTSASIVARLCPASQRACLAHPVSAQLSAGTAFNPGQILAGLDVLPASLSEECAHGFGLVVTMLQQQPAAGFQVGRGALDDGPDARCYAPQCNSDEYTSRELTRRNHPDCGVKLIPAVFVGHAIKEMHKQRALLAAAKTGSA